MPTVGLDRDELFERLGKVYTQEEFEVLCFEFGIELDDVTSEYEAAKAMGVKDAELMKLSKSVEYRIDVPANRYDILCMEGMARALRVFLGLEKCPTYSRVSSTHPGIEMTVDWRTTSTVRPYCVCAVLRGVSFTDPRVYRSFIDLQEKLHQNICRRRTLVAIGTHDLNTLKPPFFYKADDPEVISFVPLTEETKVFTGKALLDHYRTSPDAKHLKPYTSIIYDAPKYPVIRDSQGTVLSLPPIINSRHSRIQPHTKDVFIECTATDETKAHVVLDTICAMFSEYTDFTVETVPVKYVETNDDDNGETSSQVVVKRTVVTPLMTTRECAAELDVIRSTIGLSASELPDDAVCALCEKMQLAPARLDASEGAKAVVVTVPCTRSDVMHAVDVVEDVAIAYGFNNLVERLPPTPTQGKPNRLNALCDLLRDEVQRAGYCEVLTHGLCRKEENYEHLRLTTHDAETDVPVVLSNPASEDFEIVRTTLLVGIFKSLGSNKSQSVKDGLRLFEISDVVAQDQDADVGASNDRRLVATFTAASAGFELIHGLLDRVMAVLLIPSVIPQANFYLERKKTCSYRVHPVDHPTFFPGRSASIVLHRGVDDTDGLVLGKLGVVHPDVLKNFDIDFPTSALELRLEPIFDVLTGGSHGTP